MFGISDLISLVISAFIILPAVVFIREMGYVIVSWLFGVIKPRVTTDPGAEFLSLVCSISAVAIIFIAGFRMTN